MKQLILLRGLPGSGKSTFAESLTENVCEADSYFMVLENTDGSLTRHMYNGEYRFDGSLLKNAHADCRALCEDYMQWEHDKIAVSNTFTREWEMKEYYELAEKYGYTVFSIIVENRHGGKNEHGVPEEAIQKMKERFEVVL